LKEIGNLWRALTRSFDAVGAMTANTLNSPERMRLSVTSSPMSLSA
jgi:hypothetical protein